MNHHESNRARKTRRSIVQAFNRLVLGSPPRRTIGVGEVIAEAKVGRSTFYEHFSGAEQLHLSALARPFAVLADAAAGCGDVSATRQLLAHFWENRQRARDTLSGRMGERAMRLLTEMVEARLQGSFVLPNRLAAEHCAGAAMAPLRAWLLGQAPASVDALAETICRSGAALAECLRRPF